MTWRLLILDDIVQRCIRTNCNGSPVPHATTEYDPRYDSTLRLIDVGCVRFKAPTSEQPPPRETFPCYDGTELAAGR
jgi:hypothetical protein